MIKGIIFDVGDILYSTALFHEASVETLASFGINITHEKAKIEWDKIKENCQNLRKTRKQILLEYGNILGVNKKNIEIFYKKRESLWNKKRHQLKLFPGVLSTLKKLYNKGYVLSILSDTPKTGRSRRKYYTQLGFNKYFKFVLTSADVKKTKPHPKTFNTLLKKMNLEKSDIVFVAHSKDELDGAKKQRIKTIGYNLDCNAKSDYVAEHFSEIYKIVENLK